MGNLDYSNEANNILNRFYQVDTMVYVEGIDDIPFWEYLFEKFAPFTFEVKDVGGITELHNYIEKIIDNEITSIVACDADFTYVGEFPIHDNIIRTYGYSIENSLICVRTIRKVIRTIGRLHGYFITQADIQNWITELNESSYDLVFHDIANFLLKEGKIVTGDNCSKFTTSRYSYTLCQNKISSHLESINLPIDEDLEKTINDRLNNNDKVIFDLLRGHFFFSVALKYVTKTLSNASRKISLSNDAFFGALLLAFETVFDGNHIHYEYYQSSISRIQIKA